LSVSASVHVVSEPLKILEAHKKGSNMQLFWSMDFANVTVETTTSLDPQAIWSSVAGTPAILEDRYAMTFLETATPSLFYRLTLPLTNSSPAPIAKVAKFSSTYAADVFCGPINPHRNRKIAPK